MSLLKISTKFVARSRNWTKIWRSRGMGQVFRFVSAGLIQVILEWILFFVLTHFRVDVGASNLLARACAAIAGFYMNGLFTFRSSVSPLVFLRFVMSWMVLSLLDTVIVMFLYQSWGLSLTQAAKPIVDGSMAVIGFISAKFWVYRPGS